MIPIFEGLERRVLLSGVDRGADAASGGAEAAVVSAAAKPAFGAKDLPGTWRGKLVSKDGTRTAAEMGAPGVAAVRK